MKEWAMKRMDELKKGNRPLFLAGGIYLSKDEVMKDLLMVLRSLSSTGNEVVASGFLTDVIRNVSAFGLTLVPLDVRQESDRHEEAVDAITRFLGLGSYKQWDVTHS
jgi:phosphoenolpyruvate carboxylase